MYNANFKERFLNSDIKSTIKTLAKPMFAASEKIETDKSKDLGFFTKEETLEFLNSRFTINTQSIKSNVYFINAYQEWARAGIRTFPQIAKDDIDFISGIKRLVVRNPEALYKEVTDRASLTDGYFSIPGLCLAWIGLEPKEATLLLKDDVDLRMGVITYSGKVFKIADKEILEMMRAYQNTSVAYRTQNRTFEVYPQESKYFLRTMKTKNSRKEAKPITTSALSLEIKRLYSRGCETLPTETYLFEYTNVYKSGQLYRAYQKEQEFKGENVDLLSPKNRAQFHKIFDSKGDYYDYVFLYKKYKEAFNLD